MSLGREAPPWPQTSERRARTVVAPVSVAWLGPHALYLEEFLKYEPQCPRSPELIELEPGEAAHAVRARLYTFADPRRWTHLSYRPPLAATLAPGDIGPSAACDLTMTRSGDQFRGGTVGRRCTAPGSAVARNFDYQLLITEDLYWYRRPVLRQSDGELQQEVIGFDRFEPDEALFTRVAVPALPRAADRCRPSRRRRRSVTSLAPTSTMAGR